MTQSTTGPAPQAPWVPDFSTFGARLAAIRQHMGWGNVAQAARECGVPTDSWRNWEEGMEPRRITTIAMAIATRTGVDPDWLVWGPDGSRRIGGNLTDRYAPRPRVVAKVGHGDGRLKPRGRVTPVRFGTHDGPSTIAGRSVSLRATA